jgi:hypothetical protein
VAVMRVGSVVRVDLFVRVDVMEASRGGTMPICDV